MTEGEVKRIMGELADRPMQFWVLKVLGPGDLEVLTPATSSELEYVGGELCEPIDSYRSQESAMQRALAEHRRTGRVHKVVASIPLPS